MRPATLHGTSRRPPAVTKGAAGLLALYAAATD